SPDYITGPEVPPSPDYIPGLEVPPLPDYIPSPEEPQSPPLLDFVPESDLEEEPEEDPKEDLADYPADRDDDDDDGDDDDEDEDEDEEEEEEHPASADSVPPIHHMTARISIRDEPSISFPPRKEVKILLALTTPPPSPLTPLSSPLPQIPSLPPNSPTHIEILESCLPLQKRVRFASPTLSHKDDLVGAIDEIAPTTLEGVNQRATDLSTVVKHETTIIYGIMEDARDDGSQLRGRVNLLYRDRPVHRHLAIMIEKEAKIAREDWGLSMDASDYARSDVMSFCTMLVAQSALILELQSVDHWRQRVISELLASDHKRQVQLTKTLSLLSIMGYSQLVDCIDLLFCLATQYRSFVQ
ncbi:hypothetical protein Tco_0759672, partial [Tanacetum coccineum]